jgi:hypothetical protein
MKKKGGEKDENRYKEVGFKTKTGKVHLSV